MIVLRRTALLVSLLVLIGIWGAPPVNADPPGPTDYRSEVVSISPPVDELDVRFIGGDSFVELDAGGHDVVVIGYRGEPYLWFREDGTVMRNERSPSVALNEDRYADVDLPTGVDADAQPRWQQVDDDGVYPWHDHRTHWMNEARPPGAEPGDRILEGVVPLRVGGTDVDVTVVSRLLAPPNPLGSVAPAAGGFALAATGWWLRRVRGVSIAGVTASLAAVAAGTLAFVSVPAETRPAATLWALPALALVAVVVAMLLARRRPGDLGAIALLGFSGAQLAVWAWIRRDGLSRAFIPTELPVPVDRAAIAGAGSVGIAVTFAAVSVLLGRRPSGPSEC